jgi:ankyrin repeat protein
MKKSIKIIFLICIILLVSQGFPQQFNQFADAVIEKDTAKINHLLQSGVDINIQHQQTGTTVLMIASSYYYYDGMVEFLIKNGADVNLKDNEGKTALLWAASNSLPNAKLLVASEAEINEAADDGMTPFLQASLGISSGKVPIEVCELLRENGANINASLTKKSVIGWTALHYAVINGDIGLVSYLTKHGANVNKASADGLTPLYLAGLNENHEIIKLLKNAGAKN